VYPPLKQQKASLPLQIIAGLLQFWLGRGIDFYLWTSWGVGNCAAPWTAKMLEILNFEAT